MDKVLVLLDALIENEKNNGDTFGAWENAAHVAEIYEETLDEKERFLIDIFLRAAKNGFYVRASELIRSLIRLYDYGIF